MNSPTIAPGARVLIRDAEWIVKRADRTGTGGQSLQVVGVSEIVRHKEARFLTELEGAGISVLDHRTYMGDIERGEANLSLCIIDRIARGLRLPMAKLISRLDDPETDEATTASRR